MDTPEKIYIKVEENSVTEVWSTVKDIKVIIVDDYVLHMAFPDKKSTRDYREEEDTMKKDLSTGRFIKVW